MPKPESNDLNCLEQTSQVQADLQQLLDKDPETRRLAIRHLGQLGPIAAPALPNLRSTLADPDFRIRLEAAIAIGFIGTKNETQYLLPLLDDEVEAVRFQTISAFAFLKDTKVTPILLCQYERETIHVQDQILRALGHLGGSEAYSLLVQELGAENPTVRTGAVVGLSFLGDSRACSLLKQVAETDSDEIVAHEARIALLQLQDSTQ
ncbi:MAG: HEAT repeat domain-containing protein [Promethearchaeota archaeon]